MMHEPSRCAHNILYGQCVAHFQPPECASQQKLDQRLQEGAPDLVLAASGDVAHPGQRLVAGLLNDLQVAHLRTPAALCYLLPAGHWGVAVAAARAWMPDTVK